MIQTTLENPWSIVQKKIDVSRVKRFPWQEIFGKSLTEVITEVKNKGYNATQTFQILYADLKINGYDNEKMFENLKTSIGSRFAEQNSLKKRMKNL